ncbi:lymphatic vessel endothelial hyaluronic receptor 1b isoform X2 [Gadus macrocephalus]|uniref:lymphatic vessel endothelial hyaluronic receptor 1b isoform X2 n=1 Tax=Gadus macrocephalus TaxID=80720 RepID=UPI0028CB2095|nr:lymphatic vessel endothelial hyaluronic receptor 1b isoform X2 [Gadus macrocephalus]
MQFYGCPTSSNGDLIEGHQADLTFTSCFLSTHSSHASSSSSLDLFCRASQLLLFSYISGSSGVMANLWFYSPVIFLSLSIHIAFNQGQLKADPISARIAGVFMIPETGRYQFTAAEARDACLRLNATIATREQMVVALQSGFETCSFGWTDDVKKGIIPRITSELNCGKSVVGLGTWSVLESHHFAAFCFKPEDAPTTTAIAAAFKPTATATRKRYAWPTASPTQVPRHTQTPPLTKPRRRSPPRPAPRDPVRSPKPTGRSPWYSSSSSSPSSLATSSTSSLPLPSTAPRGTHRVVTSRTPARKRKSTPATPVRASSLSSFLLHPSSSTSPTTTTTTTTKTTTTRSPSENTLLHSSNGSLGGLQVALIVVGLVVLVVSIAAASWYCKLQRFLFPPPWARPQQTRDEAETEMSKQESDTHLQTQLSEEAKTEGKNASEAKPFVRPSDNNTIAAL